MRRTITGVLVAGVLAVGCGGGDDDGASAPADEEVTETTAAPAGSDEDTTTTAAADEGAETPTTEAADTGNDGGDGGSGGGGSGLIPAADLDVCSIVSTEELQPFVHFAIEPGEPFFSGSSTSSCDWESVEGAAIEDIGSISFRLYTASSFVVIDPEPYPLDGLGIQAEVEPRYGLTNVHFGDSVITIQVVGNKQAFPDIAAAYPDLAAPEGGLVFIEDVHASIALAQAFAERFAG